MSGFVLRIFFSGLIAFAPSPDGKELTVLLVNSDRYKFANGSPIELHLPLLLARAESCEGKCPTRDPEIAKHLFPDQPAEVQLDSLAAALAGGGAWRLADAELSLHAGKQGLPAPLTVQPGAQSKRPAVPSTPLERQDFGWVADLDQLYPPAGGFNPDLFAARPPKELIAARLRLRSGRVFTYSLIPVQGQVRPIHFKPAGAEGPEAPYAQALASWVAAEIQVQGDSVELVDERFGGGSQRSMRLSPQNGLVEVALLNLPELHPPAELSAAARSATPVHPAPGTHFELFFELAKHPPAKTARPIPQILARPDAKAEPVSAWDLLHPQGRDRASTLLDKLRLGGPRGPFDRVLCPMIQGSGGP
jgi:hypothetical protein